MTSCRTIAALPRVATAVVASVAYGLAGIASGAEFLVSNASQVASAAASASPGDTIVMADGVWTNQQISFAGFGSAGSPLTLRPQTPGGVTLNGSSKLTISGNYLVADGLRFEGGELGSGEHIVRFRGSNGDAANSRLTNSTIIDYNAANINTRYFWVSMHGNSNRVDHNYFSGQSHSGVTVTVWRDNPIADNHLIDNNYFGDRPEGNGNGFETIRIGTSDESLSDSFTVVENNLFERVDGEIEIISNKSGNNTFRYNTFRESKGVLTLRHGDGNLVEGNFFLGEGKDGSGGVRVIGEDQTLVNNYFHNLDGRAGGAISISAGVPGSANNEYFQVKNATIAHNTIVGVKEAAITFDDGLGSSGRTLLAEDVTIANNLVSSNQDPLFEGSEGTGWTWEGNIAFGQSLGPVTGNPGVTVVDPQLAVDADGLFRPQPGSQAIDTAVSGYGSIAGFDMDGQPRIGLADVGADEVSAAVIARKPLEEGDVGPSWLGDNPPDPTGGPGCNAAGCAIQAEDFTSILDPDGNGLTWQVTSVTEALGGQVLKAPDGDRVDLPSEAHDTIATFDLEFTTEGTYTAYYRARGFSGSTDSLFSPDDFGVDPDNAQNLTDNGIFDWEAGAATFDITASHLGVPLELRLAMREQDAEFDAFVLSLDSNLTDAELDALFDPIVGDFTGDGLVNAADYSLWRDTLNQTGSSLAADANGDGTVDSTDYGIWQSAYQGDGAPSSALAIPEPTTAMSFASLCFAGIAGRLRTRLPQVTTDLVSHPHRTA